MADRLLEYTGTVTGKDLQAQVLDDMDLERERGSRSRAMPFRWIIILKGRNTFLNLIDTRDMSIFRMKYRVLLQHVKELLLIVDATQGIQAQTISNLYLAVENNLEIIPVLNKMDMPNAMPEEVKDQIVELIGCKREDIIEASGKTGLGVEQILQAIVERVPHPEGFPNQPLTGFDLRLRIQFFPGNHYLLPYCKREFAHRRCGEIR